METLILSLVGACITWITNEIKKRYDVSARLVLLWLAVVFAVAHQLFVYFVPELMQQNLMTALTSVLWTAFWIHEFLTRQANGDPISLNILKKWETVVTEEVQWPLNVDVYVAGSDWDERGGAHEQENDEDWQFWEDTPGPAIDIEDLPELTAVSQIEYNQTKQRGKNTCTIVASAWAVGDLIHKEFDDPAKKDIVADAKEDWYEPTRWWYTDKAVNLIRHKTLEHLEEVIYFHKFPTSNRLLRDRLTKKWYRVVTWYSGNADYNKDRDDDGQVSKIHLPTTYSHLVRFKSLRDIIDNYLGRKWNIYSNTTISTMIENGTLHKWGYVFYKPNEKINKKMEEWKERVKAYHERMIINHEYLWLRWPIVRWPKWIERKANRKQDADGRRRVVYGWEWHEYILKWERFLPKIS